MRNMGGLRKKMPITFWTFLIGGFALSGFPLVTAGFWSKDEIFADAFAHGHMAVFITLAIAAFLTAFYTMRQITMTFLGEARTPEAEHAHETPWTMTAPLVVLSIFAVGYGWVGIPEHFPVIGGLLPNWFHDFVGHTLPHAPAVPDFRPEPLITSLVVSLGGLGIGWLTYRNFKSADAVDPMRKVLGPVYHFIENKYYFDEAYDFLFVKPVIWISEVFTNKMDQGVIDGILHGFGKVSYTIGQTLRDKFDTPVVNRFIGDGSADAVQWFGKKLRKVQTGRIQQYMISALGVLFIIFIALYYLVLA
jgi:NADH-quinone oxidoreductase subunit L